MEFDCFSWHGSHEIEDAGPVLHLYTHHRDSGLLDQSNADVIAEAMERFIDERLAM